MQDLNLLAYDAAFDELQPPLTRNGPLSVLARAAAIMNPVEFDLAQELACHMKIPGKLLDQQVST